MTATNNTQPVDAGWVSDNATGDVAKGSLQVSIVNNLDITAVRLEAGAHAPNDEQKWCVMEAVAWVAGEPWSDHPQCASKTIGVYCRSLNENLDDEGRQQLAPFIPRLVGTNTGQADEDRRSWLIADWMTHVHLPTWLDAAGMGEQAVQVRALPRIVDRESWESTRPVVRTVRDATWAKRQEVFGPLREKVREAVKAKLGDRAVAVDVAAAVAVDVAAAAAVDVAGDIDIDVAVAVVVAVAADVAAAAPYGATWRAVYDAVKPIFRKAIDEHPTLGPIAVSMRQSGFDLLEQLIAIGRPS